MAERVLMPRQGNTVESCVILSWKKNEGDRVAEGEVLCEVETDKATFEVESTAAGTLLARFFEEGDDVPVLTPIAAIGEPGEEVSSLAPPASQTPSRVEPASLPAATAIGTRPAETPPAPAGTAAASVAPAGGPASVSPEPGQRIAVSPRARRLAEKRGLDVSSLVGRGTGPGGRIIERDVASAAAGEPLTRAAAGERAATGARAPAVGTGIGGRVRVADLRVEATPGAAAGVEDFPGAFEDAPVSGVRKIIAERMLASLTTTAQLTLHGSADARAMLRYRSLLKNSEVDRGLRSITINDLVMFAAVRTIVDFPEMNAHFLDTHIRRFEHVHAGFAVDTDRGLMVPVVRYADALTLRELSRETNRLAQACQSGSINPDELSGATFTITNLGALGIEMFTPVLNPPQVAILGVCSIEQKPVRSEEGVEFRPHLGLSLTIDHRGVDGYPASWFLKALREAIADFDLVLAG